MEDETVRDRTRLLNGGMLKSIGDQDLLLPPSHVRVKATTEPPKLWKRVRFSPGVPDFLLSNCKL